MKIPAGLFEAIGLGADEERIYSFSVTSPGATVRDIGTAMGLNRSAVTDALTSLEEYGLVSRGVGRTVSFFAAPPDVALEVLVLKRQEELQKVRLVAAQLLSDYRAATPISAPSELVEMIRGRRSIVQRFRQLQRSAKHEVLVFHRAPFAAASMRNETELEMLAKGVRYRAIYDAEILDDPDQLAALHEMVARGEQAHVLADLPMKIGIADKQLGLIPMRLQGPDIDQAVLIHASPLLDSIGMLFEYMWNQSMPLQLTRDSDVGRAAELTSLDQTILGLLDAGVKERTIAQQLGISERTVERRVKHLMDLLGVRTRFQAGHQASLRGWVGTSPGPGGR